VSRSITYASQYESETERMWRRFWRAQALFDVAQSLAERVAAERAMKPALATIVAETMHIRPPQVRETRPPGRPRTHRTYQRRLPPVLSPAQPGVLQAF